MLRLPSQMKPLSMSILPSLRKWRNPKKRFKMVRRKSRLLRTSLNPNKKKTKIKRKKKRIRKKRISNEHLMRETRLAEFSNIPQRKQCL